MVMRWHVYIIFSEKFKRTYVGCTVDMMRRLRQHNGEIRGGAKATRMGRPWIQLSLIGPYATRSEAQIVEARIKKMNLNERMSIQNETNIINS